MNKKKKENYITIFYFTLVNHDSILHIRRDDNHQNHDIYQCQNDKDHSSLRDSSKI